MQGLTVSLISFAEVAACEFNFNAIGNVDYECIRIIPCVAIGVISILSGIASRGGIFT